MHEEWCEGLAAMAWESGTREQGRVGKIETPTFMFLAFLSLQLHNYYKSLKQSMPLCPEGKGETGAAGVGQGAGWACRAFWAY